MAREPARKIVVDGVEYHWRRSHHHKTGDCTERVVAFVAGAPSHTKLELVIVSGPDVSITAGGWGGYAGSLNVNGTDYNLNRPAVIALLIKGALEEGWRPLDKGFAPSDAAAFVRRHVTLAVAGWQ